jgi:hypothetical protein
MSKRKKRITEESQSPVTVYPRVPTSTARESFAKRYARTDESNPALDAFLLIMGHFATNTLSFTRADVLYYSRPYALEFSVVQDLFAKWIEHMHALGKIEVVEGCYSEPVFINV